MAFRDYIKSHHVAIMGAILIGAIMVSPHVMFRLKLGNAYRGIYIMQTDSEFVYLARMQEIADGHPWLGSVPFFEYKDKPPLQGPAAIDFLTVALSAGLHVSIPTAVIVLKFFLPGILFLLLYELALKLLGDGRDRWFRWATLAISLFTILGYDLTGLKSITNLVHAGNFLLWSRPENPIFGGILIGWLMLNLWSVRTWTSIKTWNVLWGSVTFLLAFTSYFFSWALMLAIVFALSVIYVLKKKFWLAINAGLMTGLGALMAWPYFQMMRLATHDSAYAMAAHRIGLFFTRTPVWNSLLAVAFLAILALTRKSDLSDDRWFFTLALLAGGFIAYGQQFVTGIMIYPFHFAQYTKPLAEIVVFSMIFRKLYPKFLILCRALLVMIITVSVGFGVLVQAYTYRSTSAGYASIQRYQDAFDWFNANAPKDCVILAKDPDATQMLTNLIPVFTSCNDYRSDNIHYLVPFERVLFNYMAYLRLQGIPSNTIEQYTQSHRTAIRRQFIWHSEYISKAAEAEDEQKATVIINQLNRDYPIFAAKEFGQELKQYRIDYIISDGSLESTLQRAIKGLKLITVAGGVYIYKL